jgi:uncharacterized protein YqgQ|tara:strand:+ start:841 stop:969 length:129 start_codon:yes stop_codon:yes gene_type:complete
MTDLEILEQLYKGNHLDKKHFERAKQILHGLNTTLKDRIEFN